jgi:hypothetical protein
MLHLKPYKLFESNENEFLSDIKDCFMHVADIGIPLKYSIDNYYMIDSNAISIDLLITLSHNISKSESGETKWGTKFKELISGDEIAEEIANAISISRGLEYKIKRAEVSWVNAGEWKLANSEKQGTGPGILTKIFQENGIVGPLDMVDKKTERARYSVDILPDFIIEKGTRLRNIKITYLKSYPK